MALIGAALGPLVESGRVPSMRQSYGNPHIAAADKRDLIGAIYRSHGVAPILSVGQAVERMAFHPVLQALLESSAPEVLAAKWLRLERYYHSTNRVLIEGEGPCRFRYRRWSTSGRPPTVAENLLICGLHIGLLTALGCNGLTCHIGRQEIYADGRTRIAGRLPRRQCATGWTIHWHDFNPRRTGRVAYPVTSESVGDRLAGLFRQDIGRVWAVREVAQALRLPARSLQRQLAIEGTTFSAVVHASRVDEASRLLTASGPTLADIGYCCGYSDQAHFQRRFKQATGLTPAQYRRLSQTP